jgi:hypothetical protein
MPLSSSDALALITILPKHWTSHPELVAGDSVYRRR